MPQSFAMLLYVAMRFSHINLTEKKIVFKEWQVDLTMVLKQKSDKDLLPNEVIHPIIQNYRKFIEEFQAFFASTWVRKQSIVNCRMDYLVR